MNFLKKYLGFFLLILTIGIGLLTFDNYGISWDEEQQHRVGQISFDYVCGGEKAQLNFKYFSDKNYGVAFELPLIFVEKLFNQTDLREIYLTRHILTHLFFLIGAFFCFLLVDFIYKNKLLATIGFLLIILNPCIYGHSFFNSKDIPFLSMFLICFYLCAIAFSRKKYIYFILLGICVGLLINLRIMGILMLCLVSFFLLIDLILQKSDNKTKLKHFYFIVIFISAALFTLYLSWPFLWGNPFENFITAFNDMSKYRWTGSVLFKGMFVKATKIDWYYSIVWFCITNPIFYLLTGFFSIALLIYKFCKNPLFYLSDDKNRNNLIFLLCFISPVLAVIFLKSVLYDSWRQLYFIYPSFVLLIIFGLNHLFKTNYKLIMVGGLLITFISVTSFMISNFPLQHVYFNTLMKYKSPEYIRKHFEMDYWGTSYKQSLEYILKHDNSELIPIAVQNFPGVSNRIILKPNERRRIKFVDRNSAKYFITEYRWHSLDYPEYQNQEYHSIKILNNSVSTIFKLR